MSQIKHLFVMDLKRLCGPLLFYALLIVAAAVSTWLHCERGVLGYDRNWSRTVTDWLPMVCAVCVGAMVLLVDPMHQVTAFWRVRPWSRRSMGWAKALFLLVVVALPVGLVSTVEALWFQLDWMWILAEIVGGMLTVLGVLWFVWFAVLCSSKGSRVFWVACVSAIVVAFSSWSLLSSKHPAVSGVMFFMGPLRNKHYVSSEMVVGLFVLSMAVLAMVVWGFRMRRRRLAFSLFGILMVAMALPFPRHRVDQSEWLQRSSSWHGNRVSFKPELPDTVPRMELSAVMLNGRPDPRYERVAFEIVLPETDGYRAYVRETQVQVVADDKGIRSNFSLKVRRTDEERYLEKLLGILSEERSLEPDLRASCHVSREVAEHTKSFRLDGKVSFGVIDLEPVVSFPLRATGTFRSGGLVCKVLQNEWPEDPQSLSMEDVRVEAFVPVDSRPLGSVEIFECQRPWVRWVERFRTNENVGSLVTLAWDSDKRVPVRRSGTFSVPGYASMELHRDANLDRLSSARLEVFQRGNYRTEVEAFTNKSVAPVTAR